MAEQVQKTKTRRETEEAEVVTETADDRNARLKKELDDLLDEIDEVLDENTAEQTIKNFVQKGGQ